MTELFHSHRHHDISAFAGSDKGIRALKISLWVLGLTAFAQAPVVWLSGSVALLADTVHNFSDALVPLPLWFAFSLSRKKATPRYPYGFHRVEDLVGWAIAVLLICASRWRHS